MSTRSISFVSVKYLLNVVLGPDDPGPLDSLFASRFDERAMAVSLYASRECIADLERRNALGAHGYSHRPLAVLAPAEIRDDLVRGAAVLEEVAGSRPLVVSYPFGTKAAVNLVVAREARMSGFVVGMTLERAFNTTLDDPLLLARLDTNDAPLGKAPLFSIADGQIAIDERLSPRRMRYREEAAA
jgi:peptidoglycan/xylan/chitin deacetylase (PgdA/CDA1 family)